MRSPDRSDDQLAKCCNCSECSRCSECRTISLFSKPRTVAHVEYMNIFSLV